MPIGFNTIIKIINLEITFKNIKNHDKSYFFYKNDFKKIKTSLTIKNGKYFLFLEIENKMFF